MIYQSHITYKYNLPNEMNLNLSQMTQNMILFHLNFDLYNYTQLYYL